MGTKELYIFKVTQKTNVVYLEFKPTPFDRKLLKFCLK